MISNDDDCECIATTGSLVKERHSCFSKGDIPIDTCKVSWDIINGNFVGVSRKKDKGDVCRDNGIIGIDVGTRSLHVLLNIKIMYVCGFKVELRLSRAQCEYKEKGNANADNHEQEEGE